MTDERTSEAVELLQRLIQTPSLSREESSAADLIERFLRQKGLEPQRSGNNVWVVSQRFCDDWPTLLLNAHIDTVKPAQGWTRDPFVATLEGDRLYGLGANDCGGGLVALMQVFLRHEMTTAAQTASETAAQMPFNLIYLASAEEEVSGKNGIESVLPQLPHIDFAIVGEPTGLQPAAAEKGLMVIDATAHGRAGHAARNEGDNAILHALRDIQLLSDPANGLFPNVSPLLGPVKTTVTMIQAGSQHNVIPDACTFVIDVRSTDQYGNEQILNTLQQSLTSELHARSLRLAPSGLPADHPLLRLCQSLGLKPFGSPTLSDQALMRFPSLKLGPGESARSHTADEYICVSEIAAAIALYSQLLDRAGEWLAKSL